MSSLSLVAIGQVGDEMGPKGSHAAAAAAAAMVDTPKYFYFLILYV